MTFDIIKTFEKTFGPGANRQTERKKEKIDSVVINALGGILATSLAALAAFFIPAVKKYLTEHPIGFIVTALMFFVAGSAAYRVISKRLSRPPEVKAMPKEKATITREEFIDHKGFKYDVYEIGHAAFVSDDVYCPVCGCKLQEKLSILWGSVFYCAECDKKIRSRYSSERLRYYVQLRAEKRIRDRLGKNIPA